jgi:hypothetical protein
MKQKQNRNEQSNLLSALVPGSSNKTDFSQADNISLQPGQWLTDNVINFFATRAVASMDNMVWLTHLNIRSGEEILLTLKIVYKTTYIILDQHKSGLFQYIKTNIIN